MLHIKAGLQYNPTTVDAGSRTEVVAVLAIIARATLRINQEIDCSMAGFLFLFNLPLSGGMISSNTTHPQ